MLSTRLAGRAAAVVAALGCVAGSATAQVHFTPYTGAYYSASSLGSLQDASLAGAEVVQTSGVIVGGAVDLPLSAKLGIEVDGSFGLSDGRFQITTVASGTQVTAFIDESGWIAHTSVVARLNVTQTGNFFLVAGPGLSMRGGDAWTQSTLISNGLEGADRMSFGGVVGLGVLARVAPGFTLDVRALTFVYTFDPDGDLAAFDSAANADVMVKLGLRLPGN